MQHLEGKDKIFWPLREQITVKANAMTYEG